MAAASVAGAALATWNTILPPLPPKHFPVKGVLPPILDNMIHDGRLPVMIAIMINSGGGDGKGSERGLEYDTVSERYTTFIETEGTRPYLADPDFRADVVFDRTLFRVLEPIRP